MKLVRIMCADSLVRWINPESVKWVTEVSAMACRIELFGGEAFDVNDPAEHVMQVLEGTVAS